MAFFVQASDVVLDGEQGNGAGAKALYLGCAAANHSHERGVGYRVPQGAT